MSDKPTRIIIPQAGIASGDNKPRAVYSATSSRIISALGKVETQRASHVEPGGLLGQKALALLYPDYANRDDDDPRDFSIRQEYESYWFADMTPTGHDVVLGPFGPEDRDFALESEVWWLHKHNIPVCESCRK